MIPSARPTVDPVAIINFTRNSFVLSDFEKRGLTDAGRTIVKIVITTGRDCGSAKWINKG